MKNCFAIFAQVDFAKFQKILHSFIWRDLRQKAPTIIKKGFPKFTEEITIYGSLQIALQAFESFRVQK